MNWKPRKKLAWALLSEFNKKNVSNSGGVARINEYADWAALFVKNEKNSWELIAQFDTGKTAQMFTEDLGLEIEG